MWFDVWSRIYRKEQTPAESEPQESKVFADDEAAARQKLLRLFHSKGYFAATMRVQPIPLSA